MTAFLFDILVRASALLALTALVDAALRRRAPAAARHLLWSLAIVALLVLPIAASALPEWLVPVPIVPASSTVLSVAVTPAVDLPRGTDLPPGKELPPRGGSHGGAVLPALFGVYLAGVLLLLARLGLEPFALRRLTRASRELTDPTWRRLLHDASQRVGVRRKVRLLRHEGENMPLTFGTFTPIIVVPASADAWTEDRRRAVLLHELAHVARRDCFIQRLSACACALYWPHPGVWYAARRLRAERELACDDRVIAAGAPADDYAGHLLEIAHQFRAAPAPATALGMARARQLEHRLLAILDDARNRAALGRGRRSVIVSAAILVFVPMAVLQAVLVPSDPAPRAAAQTSSAGASATQELTGTWELHLSRAPGRAQLTIRRGGSSHGRTLPLAELESLAGTTIATAKTLRFRIPRDAGTFTIEGLCRNGACAGTFGFEPSAPFAADLAKRGIGRPTPEDQFHLAVADVGAAYLDALAAGGYRTPDIRGLVRAAQHGVDLGYLREMTALGYRLGTIDELVRLRDHGVDPEYIRGMAANGYAKLTADDLVRARDHGVDPGYVGGMRVLGHAGLSLDDLVTARDHGVDPEYARGMAELGYKLPIHELRRARDHGVDPDYTRAMAQLGYKGVPLESLIRMRDHGVDPAYVRRLQQQGVSNLTVDEIIRRRDRGGN